MKKKLLSAVTAAYLALCQAQTVFAAPNTNKVEKSKISTGTKALLNDVMLVIQILAPIIGIILIIYYQIRKAAADEQDQKTWSKRTSTTIVCVVMAELASVIVNLVLSYYQ